MIADMTKYCIATLQLTALLFLLNPVDVCSQAGVEDLAKGNINERVASLTDSSQSYALYLPSSYAANKKWPILYALDPGARGELPVRRFKDGAEKYGYIVVGSNNSQNGPIEVIQDAINAVIADTHLRFSLDTHQEYVAGFSGGARAAILIGRALNEKIAGIIVCGGGFPPSMPPSASMRFPLAMAVGIEDYFFPELRALNRLLDNIGVTHHLEIFQGGHEWPPETVCTRIFEWIELQAMKSGICAKDDLFVDQIFTRAVDEARQNEISGQTYEACLHYAALLRDFTGLRDVKAFEGKVDQLKQARNYRKALAQEKQIESRQRRSEEMFNKFVGDAVNDIDRAAADRQLHNFLADLKEKSNQTKHETDRLIAKRVLTRFWIQLSESVSLDFAQKQYSKAVIQLELMKELQPDHFEIYFHIARAYSLEGNRKEAIDALRDAIRRGFTDVSFLQNSRDFESLRKEREFQTIIEEMKGQY
jgi:dienelactone hydrolase